MKVAIVLASLLLSFSVQAQVRFVALHEPTGNRFFLSDEQGICLGDAHMALWVAKDTNITPVPGCWVELPDNVQIAFFDGDTANIPKEAFKRVEDI